MPTVIAGNIYEVTTYVRFNNVQNQLNVHHYKAATLTGAAPDEQLCMQAVANALNGAYKPIMSLQQVFAGIKYKRAETLGLPSFTRFVTGGSGTRSGDSLPPQVAAVVKWVASGSALSFRGRSYLPSPTENDGTSVGALGATYLNDVDTWSVNVLTLTALVGLSTVVFTRQARKQIGLTVSYQDQTSAQTRAFFGTQRRRSGINRGDLPLS